MKLKVKNELDTVYITSSGDKYLNEMDALCAEAQIQMTRTSIECKKEKIMDIVELVQTVLRENNWGIYNKSNPMADHPMQDGGTLYKINEVDEEEVERVILKRLTECQKHSQTDSNQNKNSITG